MAESKDEPVYSVDIDKETDESDIPLYNPQTDFEGKAVSSNETNISTSEESCIVETCKVKAYINNDGKDESAKQIFCEICTTDALPVQATHFCKTCEDPDPLCENCVHRHLKEMLSKNHEICCFIKDFRKSRNKYGNQILCEICTTDEQVLATHFCKTCEDPDPLCENCANRHLKEKLSKHHEICDNMKDFQKR